VARAAAFDTPAPALAAHADLFLSIAKLRAARRLVARVAEACGAAGAGRRLNLTVTTSERMLTKRDPWVNILRAAVACAGAAIGGGPAPRPPPPPPGAGPPPPLPPPAP